jgi:protein-disulfide isomerase
MRIRLLLLASTFSCGTGRPAPRDPADEAEHRQLRAAIEKLDARVAALSDRLDRAEGAPASKGAELSVDDRLERLAQKQAELEADVARQRTAAAPAPSPGHPRPDAGAIYAVKVDGFPSRGPKDAPVTLVRSYEFACPYSHKSLAAMEELLAAYPKDLRIVYRSFVVHPQQATIPARAVCAAHRQGKFTEMHDLIWTQGFEANRNLGMDNMEKLAGDLKLDLAKFARDTDGVCVKKVEEDQADLTTLGQNGTPSFWINGRFLSGARPTEDFKAIIDEELAAASKAIGKNGITRANYYRKVVLKKGKTKL